MVSRPRCANSHRVPARVTPPRPRPHILAHSDVTASWMTRLCSSALVSLFAALEGLGTPMPCRGSWGRFCDDPQAFALPCVCVRRELLRFFHLFSCIFGWTAPAYGGGGERRSQQSALSHLATITTSHICSRRYRGGHMHRL